MSLVTLDSAQARKVRLLLRWADGLAPVQDVLVVTAPGSGAEIIPFLKTYVNLPLALLFTIGYSQVRVMSSCSSHDRMRARRRCTYL
jgi:TLC ATP/ADP transporter